MTYYQMQKAAGLTNGQAAFLFKVNITTIKRWRSGEKQAPHPVYLCLESIIKNEPVSFAVNNMENNVLLFSEA